jgi:hypothetical protein
VSCNSEDVCGIQSASALQHLLRRKWKFNLFCGLHSFSPLLRRSMKHNNPATYMKRQADLTVSLVFPMCRSANAN